MDNAAAHIPIRRETVEAVPLLPVTRPIKVFAAQTLAGTVSAAAITPIMSFLDLSM
jgi:hypothetical protein